MTNSSHNTCIVIPTYNHHLRIEETVAKLKPFGFAIIIVDDGSDEVTQNVLAKVSKEYPEVTLLRHDINQGKGAALKTAFKYAYTHDFTHAIQIDADGQHALQDLPLLHKASINHPQALVTGHPIYDASVPKGRLYGRYVTHFWVWIETLSFDIKDSMCGYRVYPLAICYPLIQTKSLGQRMTFDIEIMVHLHWNKTPIINVPTKVVYPEDGSSHFKLWRDNLSISWMHTCLTCGMLLRLPKLLMRKWA